VARERARDALILPRARQVYKDQTKFHCYLPKTAKFANLLYSEFGPCKLATEASAPTVPGWESRC